MDAKTVIDTLLRQEKVTRYRLAKRLGINQSLISRAYNGKSDPGFNEISRWLDDLGYSLVIVADKNKALENVRAFDINYFGRALNEVDPYFYDYLEIHRMLKQVLENSLSEQSLPIVFYYPESIQSDDWRAFYAATIAYLYKCKDKRVPKFAGIVSNRTENAWSPIKRLGRSHTEFDETFLEYNVLLPRGELSWI